MKTRMGRSILLLVLLGIAGFAEASVVEPMSLEQLVKASDRIVRGEVGHARSLLDPDQRRIVTDIEVKVLVPLKGGRDTALTVRVGGGIIGTRGQRVSGSPLLRKGDEVMLFLEDVPSTPEGRPRCRVVGMARGVYFFRSDPSGRQVAVQRLNDLEVQAPGDTAPRALQADKPVRRTKFLRQVRALIRKTSR